MGVSISELYDLYMDIDPETGLALDESTPFVEDIYEMFAPKGQAAVHSLDEFKAKFGGFIPEYDPTKVYLAERERDLALTDAYDLLITSQNVADRIYDTETDIISSGLGKEIGKSREISGRLGLKSGALESAVEETIGVSSDKVKDLGDRYTIQRQEDLDKHNAAVVESALDFDKAEYQVKEDFYQDFLRQIRNLSEVGAFDEKDIYYYDCMGTAITAENMGTEAEALIDECGVCGGDGSTCVGVSSEPVADAFCVSSWSIPCRFGCNMPWAGADTIANCEARCINEHC